jgi:hypothetical protein
MVYIIQFQLLYICLNNINIKYLNVFISWYTTLIYLQYKYITLKCIYVQCTYIDDMIIMSYKIYHVFLFS